MLYATKQSKVTKNYILFASNRLEWPMSKGIGDCTPTCDRGQSEVKRLRQNFEAGQAVKVGIGGSLETVKGSPGDQWA